MCALILIAVASTLLSGRGSATSDSAYAPLWRYQGVWHTRAGDSSEELVNRCSRMGRYFACEQTVNGVTGALIVFIPAKTAGHYHTQAVTPEGRATGRGTLEIMGETWIYSGEAERDERGFLYRTVNFFKGEDHIHYEQQRSADGKTWTTVSAGDEVRISKAAPPETEEK